MCSSHETNFHRASSQEMMECDTDESWEPSDEYLSNDPVMNIYSNYPANADFATETVETCTDKRLYHSCGEASLQADVFAAQDEPMSPVPTNRNSVSLKYSEPTIFPGSTKRKRQGLHGKQATQAIPYNLNTAVFNVLAANEISFWMLRRIQRRHERLKLKNGAPKLGEGRCLFVLSSRPAYTDI